MRHLPIALAVATILATAALATERKQGQTPAPGAEATATVGSPLLERYNLLVNPGVRLGGNVDVNLGLQGVISISAGTLMALEGPAPAAGGQLRACTTTPAYTNMMRQTGPACLTDRDGDGTFDTASAKKTGMTTRHLPAPVPYARDDVPVEFGANNQRVTLTYMGAAGGVLRLSYREFSNDMARPAATEELSFPLGPTFPQTITWRDARITLLALSNDGLRYKVEPAQ